MLRSDSVSKSRSRSNASHRGHPYLATHPDDFILPEGSITEEQVGLLQEFVHPHRHGRNTVDSDATAINEEDEEDDELNFKNRPWYKRPSPLWLLGITPLTSIAMTACLAPRVELYTQLVCRALKPEYAAGGEHDPLLGFSNTIRVASVVNGLDISLRHQPHAPASSLSTLLISSKNQSDIAYLHPHVFSTSSSKRDQEDDRDNQCASDPTVQAAAAKLIAVLTTTTGLLSCLTTTFWASLSDSYGRLRVLGLCVVGLLTNDLTFICVNFLSQRFPGGYWFLLLGACAEGTFGGLSTVVAAMHAYFADCTPPGTRSRVFSLGTGLLFVGMGIGPTLGSILVHETRNLLSVFYAALAVHVLYAFWLWFVVPESLAPAAMRRNRERQRKREEMQGLDDTLISGHRNNAEGALMKGVNKISAGVRRTFAFLSPLSIFIPAQVHKSHGHDGKSSIWNRDWSLTLVVVGYGVSALIQGSYQYKFQYAQATFGWKSEELGYFLSIVGATRALFLTVILPFIIKRFNKPRPAIRLPTGSSESLQIPPSPEPPRPRDLAPDSSSSVPTPSSSNASSRIASPNPTSSSERSTQHTAIAPHSPKFDLYLARVSLVLEAICFSVFPFALTPTMFVGIAVLTSFSGGFNPAVQALALELYTKRELKALEAHAEFGSEGSTVVRSRDRDDGELEEGDVEEETQRNTTSRRKNVKEVETGRLFGAISVVQALCTQILGPLLFGLLYMATVATYPRTIFFVSAGAIIVSFFCLFCVHFPSNSTTKKPHNIVIRVDVDVSTSRDGSPDRINRRTHMESRTRGEGGEERVELLGAHDAEETLTDDFDDSSDLLQRQGRGRKLKGGSGKKHIV